MVIAVAVAIAGFAGAVSRYGIGLAFPDNGGAGFPWATLFINLAGSLLLGLLFGLASRGKLPQWFKEAAGTGFLGAFTTFSAFNGQLWLLWENHAYGFALAYALASGAVGWALAAAGLAWGGKERSA
ncbi:fluoride efflux transporter FluC [Cohnella panacarvi]|uniref:fluoride efflux transporter FluC n=1 Tax=Cohnella panacarvi TaxID=400776 RepID=UPI00047CF330|nr:CrcB family protein [Cohnella panacarvi]